MAIGFVELNGMIGRTQDYSAMKQQEDQKPIVQQANMQLQAQKSDETKARVVIQSENSSKSDNHQDARDKGSNEYHGDGGAKRPHKFADGDGKVIVKGQSHFEMKI